MPDFRIFIMFVLLLAFLQPVAARPIVADKYPESLLYGSPVEVVPNVWVRVGAIQSPAYDNYGHNSCLSLILAEAGIAGRVYE